MIRLEYWCGGVKNYEDRDALTALQELILDLHIKQMTFTSPDGKKR